MEESESKETFESDRPGTASTQATRSTDNSEAEEATVEADENANNSQIGNIRFQREGQKYVMIKFNLLNWQYMDFSLKFAESTRIFSIKNILQKRHGVTDDPKICLHHYSEENIILDEMLTLRECGCEGRVPKNATVNTDGTIIYDDSELPVYQIYYDVKPLALMDPLLLY